MMISSKNFYNEYKDCSYAELIKVRDELISEITEFEYKEKNNIRDSDWEILPSPATVYSMNLEYLQQICILMAEKYDATADCL